MPLYDAVDQVTLDELKENFPKRFFFFWAEWQEASKLGGPLNSVFQALSQKFSNDCFIRIEAEKFPQCSENFGITVVPTFVAVDGDYVVGKFEGANPADISKLLKELQQFDSSSIPKPVTLEDRLIALTNQSKVVLFMKGAPGAPRCGFSRQIVEILQKHEVEFSSFDILTDEEVRQGLKTFSDWPTYPQLYVKGNLIGGLDIVKEMVAAVENDSEKFRESLFQ